MVCVSNYMSNICIILGQLTSQTCMNTINFEEGQLLRSLQVTLIFQPSLKRSLDQSFLQTLEEFLANIVTHHKHSLSVPTTETDQEQEQSRFPNNFFILVDALLKNLTALRRPRINR